MFGEQCDVSQVLPTTHHNNLLIHFRPTDDEEVRVVGKMLQDGVAECVARVDHLHRLLLPQRCRSGLGGVASTQHLEVRKDLPLHQSTSIVKNCV